MSTDYRDGWDAEDFLTSHVVYCRGCQHAWIQVERIGLMEDGPIGDCACTCTDDMGPEHYEDWVVDPDPADVPPGAWALCAGAGARVCLYCLTSSLVRPGIPASSRGG